MELHAEHIRHLSREDQSDTIDRWIAHQIDCLDLLLRDGVISDAQWDARYAAYSKHAESVFLALTRS